MKTQIHMHMKHKKGIIKKEVSIYEVGDVVQIPLYKNGLLMTDPNNKFKDKLTGDMIEPPIMRDFTFNLPRSLQNRSKQYKYASPQKDTKQNYDLRMRQ